MSFYGRHKEESIGNIGKNASYFMESGFSNGSRAVHKKSLWESAKVQICYPKYSWRNQYSVSRVVVILITCFPIFKHGISLV